MGALQRVQRTHIAFNAANAEHRAVYWKLKTSGRQDEHLRFIVEEGFSSVLTMMQVKIADHFSKPNEETEGAVQLRRKAK